MSTDSKYYTPDMSEFYHGFEYEQNTFIPIFNQDGGWDKRVYHGQLLSNPRVKLLDSEDIENEGWLPTEHEFEFSDYFLLFNKSFHLWKKDIDHNAYFIHHLDDNNYCDKYIISIENHSVQPMKVVQIFNGDIKNISELRKLQQQLGIK